MPTTMSAPLHWGKEIFRTDDEYGPIRVFDDGNKRYLSFDESNEQSCVHKRIPSRLLHEYACAMLLPLLFLQPRHITLFGLGGGSLASCLFHLLPAAQIQVVELRAQVLAVARRFFHLPQDSRLDVTIMDAGDYLQHPKANTTDLLLSDMYFAGKIDKQQQQAAFIRNCHSLLSESGWLALNYSERSECTDQAMAVFIEAFAETRLCQTPCGNAVLFAGKSTVPLSERELMTRCKQLNQVLGFPITRFAKNFGRLARRPPATNT